MCTQEINERIRQELQQSLSPRRYRHTLGVAAAARRLALANDVAADKAETAGLLHDAAKELPLPDMQRLAVQEYGRTLPETIFRTASLLHGYAATTIARERYQIDDDDILKAIAHHTTGAAAMGLLEKIIFMADYIEENRDFEGVETLREITARSLDEGVLAGYDMTILHLLEQHKTIYAGTVTNRNAHLLQMRSQGGRD